MKRKSPMLDLQITLARERLTELRERRRKLPSIKVGLDAVGAMDRRKLACRMRSRGMIFRLIAEAMGVSTSRARELSWQGLRYYLRRMYVPAIHDLRGETWMASNCDYTWEHDHCFSKLFSERSDNPLVSDLYP